MGQEKVDALKQIESLTAERDAAQKELREARKAALLEAHKTCPPPDAVAKETQEQTITPMVVSASGKRKWLTDYDKATETATHLHREVLLILSTTGCIHCENAASACAQTSVFDKIQNDKKFVPCWLTILDKKTKQLAEELGVYEVVDYRTGRTYGCPAAFAIDPVTGKFHRFRPSEDEAGILKQLETEKAELVK